MRSVLTLLAFLPATALAAVVDSTGDVFIGAAAPASSEEGLYENDNTIGGWEEAQLLVLPRDVAVDISTPGAYAVGLGLPLNSPGVLPAGTTVSSHYFHGDSTGNSLASWAGSITFNAPIVGIQTLGTTMEASDDVFNEAGTAFDATPTERDFDTRLSDYISWDANDPYTLVVDHAADSGMDEFRVITAAVYLEVSGSCPGTIDISWGGMSPGGQAAFVTASSVGSFLVPGGPCTGVSTLDLAAPVTLRAILGVGAEGQGSLSPTVGPAACGLQLQVLDLNSCLPSQVVTLP